jgi:hypothetical protein
MVENIEETCNELDGQAYARHEIEAPALTWRETIYPLGFPTILRTNSEAILQMSRKLWSVYANRFETEPIRVDVHLIESDSVVCPPTPTYRIAPPLLISMADGDNYSVAELESGFTKVVVSTAALRHPSYLEYFFLTAAPMSHIATRFVTPVHAGCVSLDGRGVLLCGESGAGKSSLSYACARAGWTYTTDDASYMRNETGDTQTFRTVTGNCHQIRFRPTASELFAEIGGREITPRAAGKPSIEIPTSELPSLACSPTAEIDALIFLNRNSVGDPRLSNYSKSDARAFLRSSLYGPPRSRALQHESIERLLTAEVYELHYRDLDWAVGRLTSFVRGHRL